MQAAPEVEQAAALASAVAADRAVADRGAAVLRVYAAAADIGAVAADRAVADRQVAGAVDRTAAAIRLRRGRAVRVAMADHVAVAVVDITVAVAGVRVVGQTAGGRVVGQGAATDRKRRVPEAD